MHFNFGLPWLQVAGHYWLLECNSRSTFRELKQDIAVKSGISAWKFQLIDVTENKEYMDGMVVKHTPGAEGASAPLSTPIPTPAHASPL